jgi:hypothetical protein
LRGQTWLSRPAYQPALAELSGAPVVYPGDVVPTATLIVPFSCRLEDATSGNKQQLEATGGNSQRSEVKAFRLQQQQAATPGNTLQLDRNPALQKPPRAILLVLQRENPVKSRMVFHAS